MEAEKKLWVPPVTTRERVEVVHQRKVVRLKAPKMAKPLKVVRSIRTYVRTGLHGRSLWDWLRLLLPLAGVIALCISLLVGVNRLMLQQDHAQAALLAQLARQQDALAKQLTQSQDNLTKQLVLGFTHLVAQEGSIADQGHEQILSDYLNNISSVLGGHPAPAHWSQAVRVLVQTRTMAILSALRADPQREGIVLQFLHDSGLILVGTSNAPGPIISLSGVNLSGVILSNANMTATNFDNAILSNANLSGSILTGSSFRGATLTKANLSGVSLQQANLSGASMENVDLTNANLQGANLNGADTKNAKVKGVQW